MERNQAIGLVLISAIMMTYFIYFGNQKEQNKVSENAATGKVEIIKKESTQPIAVDTAQLNKKFGGFAGVAQGISKEEILSNKDISVTFNSKGGKIERVLLKNY